MFEYRTIPAKVEAVRWRRDLAKDLMPDWLIVALSSKKVEGRITLVGNRLHVKTTAGLVIAEEGDWIVHDRRRELTIYQDQEFERRFERIEKPPKIRSWKDGKDDER